ncbi:hypothetical protein DL98DRAFT_532326 [Cadophora sp. DSE1049]|nr:hypothetical protein DL98DRAFT_532326 [Cadophora sp. DSE1049]
MSSHPLTSTGFRSSDMRVNLQLLWRKRTALWAICKRQPRRSSLCCQQNLRSATTSSSSATRGTAESPDVPIWPVHIDFTEEAGMQRVKKMLTESEAQLYLCDGYHVRIINSWRPLQRPVENSPLGFCDPWTIQKQDLVAADRPAQDQSSEAYYLKYGAHQEYYWCSNQSPSEISLFTS